MSFAPDTETFAKPQVLFRVPVGMASPLWGLFAGAAMTGATWWWMTRWARPQNLEAMFGGATEAEAVIAPEPAAFAAPTAEAVAVIEAVAEPVIEAAPEPVMEAVVEAAPEPVAEVVAEAPTPPVLEAVEPEIAEPAVAVEALVEAAAEPAPMLRPKKKPVTPEANATSD